MMKRGLLLGIALGGCQPGSWQFDPPVRAAADGVFVLARLNAHYDSLRETTVADDTRGLVFSPAGELVAQGIGGVPTADSCANVVGPCANPSAISASDPGGTGSLWTLANGDEIRDYDTPRHVERTRNGVMLWSNSEPNRGYAFRQVLFNDTLYIQDGPPLHLSSLDVETGTYRWTVDVQQSLK